MSHSRSSMSISDFLETTTIHGLTEIYRTKSRRTKAIFITAFVLCNLLSIYECCAIIRQYLERPVATSYFVHEADNLTLPDVTICPFNRFNRKYLEAKGVPLELMLYVEWAFFRTTPRYDFFDVSLEFRSYRNQTGFFEAELDQHLKRLNMSFYEFVKAAGTQCRDIVTKCVSNFGPYDCCKVSTSIITTFGHCFRIPGILQVGSGFGMGMSLMINIPFDKYTPSNNLALNDGIMIKLTEPGKGFEYDAIFIPTGVHSLLQLRATEMEFMNDPPRYTCLKKVKRGYAPILCFQQCLLEPMELECRCKYVGVGHDLSGDTWDAYSNPNASSSRACRAADILNCGYQSLEKTFMRNKRYATDCKSKCKARCNYWQYQSTVSFARFPSRTMADLHFRGNAEAEKTEHYTELSNSQIILELFFEKLEYTLIKHFPSMTADTFLANIGGQLGLWLGGSILSFVHLIVFLCLVVCSDRKGNKPFSRRTRKAHPQPATVPPRFTQPSLQQNGIFAEYIISSNKVNTRDTDKNSEPGCRNNDTAMNCCCTAAVRSCPSCHSLSQKKSKKRKSASFDSTSSSPLATSFSNAHIDDCSNNAETSRQQHHCSSNENTRNPSLKMRHARCQLIDMRF